MRPAEKLLVADYVITSSLTANGRAFAVRYASGDYWFADAKQLLAWLPWQTWTQQSKRVKEWVNDLLTDDRDYDY